MGEFVECGDSSPHGSESGDESPHSTLGGLNDDQGPSLLITTDYSGAFTGVFGGVVDADGLAVSAPEAFAPSPE